MKATGGRIAIPLDAGLLADIIVSYSPFCCHHKIYPRLALPKERGLFSSRFWRFASMVLHLLGPAEELMVDGTHDGKHTGVVSSVWGKDSREVPVLKRTRQVMRELRKPLPSEMPPKRTSSRTHLLKVCLHSISLAWGSSFQHIPLVGGDQTRPNHSKCLLGFSACCHKTFHKLLVCFSSFRRVFFSRENTSTICEKQVLKTVLLSIFEKFVSLWWLFSLGNT